MLINECRHGHIILSVTTTAQHHERLPRFPAYTLYHARCMCTAYVLRYACDSTVCASVVRVFVLMCVTSERRVLHCTFPKHCCVLVASRHHHQFFSVFLWSCLRLIHRQSNTFNYAYQRVHRDRLKNN